MSQHADGGVEVLESGRALKVQSEVPHLVSLGGGRLSTAVTLHPLPEGRMTIGSCQTADIPVQGTGVEPVHCHIDNIHGVVMLHPVAEMTAVDGLPVVGHTRLSQGSMICIGRSNYLRFNHPAEARIMRSILPNTRISMVPLNFCTGSDNLDGLDRKPPIAPRRSPRDSWGDVSNSSSCNSGSEECYLGTSTKINRSDVNTRSNQVKSLSPKVFPMGSATVNSPASAVLGPYHTSNQVPSKNVHNLPSQSPSNGVVFRNGEFPNNATIYNQNSFPTQALKLNPSILRNGFTDNGSAFNTPITSKPQNSASPFVSSSYSSGITNGLDSRSQTPNSVISQTSVNKCLAMQSDSLRSVTPSPPCGDNRTIAERRLGSMSSLPSINTSLRESSSPTSKTSNSYEHRVLTTPSPAFNRNPSPATRTMYTPRSLTPTPPKGSNIVVHRRHPSLGSVENMEPSRQLGSPTPSYGSNCSLEELAARKEGLEHKRNQAQADRLQEQETERQERARLDEILNMCADYEKQVQLERQSKSPIIPQNRIKTNGSLPRDKRLPSPGTLTSEDELVDIFTFEQTPVPASVPSVAPPPAPSGANTSVLGRSPYENVVLSGGSIAYPQSPRTRIRTIANKEANHNRDNSEVIENRLAILNDYEFVSSLPRRLANKTPVMQESPSTDNRHSPTQLSHSSSPYMNVAPIPPRTAQHSRSLSTPATSNQKPLDRAKLILPLDSVNPVDRLNEALEAMKAQNAQTRCDDRRRSLELKHVAGQHNTDCGLSIHDRGSQIHGPTDLENQEQQTERWRVVYDGLRKERSKLLAAMSDLKQNITDIEQQEEEMLRELEMERALLDGEWSAQRDKLCQDEERQVILRAQLAKLDKEVAHFSAREVQRQEECKRRLEAAEQKVHQLENEFSKCSDNIEKQKMLADRLKTQKELLEQEKKLFEDLEFRHLEEEAYCLAGHEELQRELSEVSPRVDIRQRRLEELEEQKLAAQHSAEKESQALQRQLLTFLRSLEEIRNRARTIEIQLDDLSSRGLVNRQDSSPDASSDADESIRPSSIQSPEDLARISRVTSRAPLELGTGSLGRRTLESLQTIERNRHLHLAQQGGIVIENERKRVEELKRRAQDEVRAQWAEQRQNENNCNSLNSVGSDDVSSDVPTESASSDDTVDKRKSALDNADDKYEQHKHNSTSQQPDLMREKELAMERNREETRPLTDGSDYEHLAVHMRDRDKASRLQHQRPLTRYLPIRSERLDLRQHIETAGHQVELCQHVFLDTTSCRGFLQKLGSTFHHWAKRWFVFDRNQRTFTYYADRSEKKARGGAYFQAIEEVYVDHLNSVKSPNPQLTFVVKTSDRTYHLMAPSAEAMRIWVDVVFTGAEGYQAFEHGS